MFNGDERLNEDALAYSKDYQRTMDELILPELSRIRRDSCVTGDGGHPVFCSVFEADRPKGTVVIVHGFTECVDKFDEMIYSLVRNGFSVCAYDQRGHGRSWRAEGLPDASVTHVDDFMEYVRDLECVIDQAAKRMTPPLFLFAHSMGGAVSALYLEDHPGVFERAVLSSPMIACSRGGVPYFPSKVLFRLMDMLGKGKKRSFVSPKPYAGPEEFETSSAAGKERFDWYERIRAANPKFQNNGPTNRWVLEALKTTQRILAAGRVERVNTPVLLFSAENDSMVLPEEQKTFVKRLSKGSLRTVSGAKHEIYRSGDDVLFPWWHEVLTWFSEGNTSV